MDFDDIIMPLDRATFLSGYREKTWLHQTGAPGRFAGLMPWGGTQPLLQNARLASPLIKLSQDGVTIDADRYIHTAPGAGNLPRIDAGRITALLADGATLILNMVEDLSPRIRALSESVREALSGRNYVNLYAGWKSQKGFDLHWDAHEVLVLQIHGRKRWQIFAPTQDHPLDAGVPPKPPAPRSGRACSMPATCSICRAAGGMSPGPQQ